MHSTACGVGASATNISTLQSTADGIKMVHNNDDAMNKIPLKSASGLDDEEKNGGELMQDTAAAEEARREQMRANMLAWMKKLTIVLICFIGIALISYVIISLCFSDEPAAQDVSTSSSASAVDSFATAATTPHDLLAPAVAASTLPTMPPAADTPLDTPDSSDAKFESKLGIFQKAAVCSDKQACSQIGSDILARNGSAVDAAIAALLCNGLLTMHSMGIGGGHMMNIYVRKTRQAYSIDAREVAPFATEPNMFDKNPKASYSGPLSIAVPGELMGYHHAHESFGKLPWRELVEPSLKLCKHGFYLSQHQAMALRLNWSYLKNATQLHSVFVNATTGEPHAVGTHIKPLPQLCKTYELLAENGPLDLYNGTLAELLAEDLKQLGSIITDYDLKAYFADKVHSITMPLGEDTLYTMPPVSSGAIVAHILSILEGYNFTRADLANDEAKARTIHRFVEAMKFGFARRSELGDLRFNDVRELVSHLTSSEYGAAQRAKLNDSHVLNGPQEYGANFNTQEDYDGTSQLVVLAPNGDAVSVTSSINAYFGSGLVGPRTGIILNNAMNDFSVENNFFELPASISNSVEARKRPMSSMAPMLLADSKGDIRLAIGAAGGSRIPGGIVEVATRLLWFGEDLKAAIDAPRYYHQLLPDELVYEKGSIDEPVLELLKQRGHKLKPLTAVASVVCAISRNETAIYANADYRKRGGIAGF